MSEIKVEPCKKCKAPIFFMKTEENRKWMPLDAKPERRFEMITKEEKDMLGNTFQVQFARSVPVYTPHWATCPFADQFRRDAES